MLNAGGARGVGAGGGNVRGAGEIVLCCCCCSREEVVEEEEEEEATTRDVGASVGASADARRVSSMFV